MSSAALESEDPFQSTFGSARGSGRRGFDERDRGDLAQMLALLSTERAPRRTPEFERLLDALTDTIYEALDPKLSGNAHLWLRASSLILKSATRVGRGMVPALAAPSCLYPTPNILDSCREQARAKTRLALARGAGRPSGAELARRAYERTFRTELVAQTREQRNIAVVGLLRASGGPSYAELVLDATYHGLTEDAALKLYEHLDRTHWREALRRFEAQLDDGESERLKRAVNAGAQYIFGVLENAVLKAEPRTRALPGERARCFIIGGSPTC